MSYINKVKKLHNGRLPKSFSIHMKHMLYKPDEKEQAAKVFFKVLMTDKEEKKKAKKLGLI